MKVISKSIYVLMVIDALIFEVLTLFTAANYNIPEKNTILTTILFTVCGVYVLFMKGFYKIRNYELDPKDAYLLFEGIVLAAVIPFVTLLFFDFNWLAFKFLLVDVICIYIVIFIWRKLFYYHRKYLKPSSNILIIGAGDVGKIMAKEILNRPMLKQNLVGFVDNYEECLKFDYEGIKVIGKTSNLKKIIEGNDIKTIIIAITEELDYQTLMDISECIPQGVDIWKMSDYYELITQKIPITTITPEWFMYDFTVLDTSFYDFFKRIFDIVAAIIILIVTLPVLIAIAIYTKLYDGGPIFYLQNRVGKNNKTFKVYKLRTMCVGAEETGMFDKGDKNDDRIIPFCKWVRKARFDEIPQMINILKGEMSVVGPRVEFVNFAQEYEKEIPFFNRRHWITPGWTGYAHINQGHVVGVDPTIEKLRYDFYYIKHRNIFWDFEILIKAVFQALSGRLN